MIALGWADCNC